MEFQDIYPVEVASISYSGNSNNCVIDILSQALS